MFNTVDNEVLIMKLTFYSLQSQEQAFDSLQLFSWTFDFTYATSNHTTTLNMFSR